MRLSTILLASLPLLVGWIPAFAQADDVPKPNPVILADEPEKHPQSVHLELLEDASGQLTNERTFEQPVWLGSS